MPATKVFLLRSTILDLAFDQTRIFPQHVDYDCGQIASQTVLAPRKLDVLNQ